MSRNHLSALERRLRAVEQRAANQVSTGVIEVEAASPQELLAKVNARPAEPGERGHLVMPTPVEDSEAWAAEGRVGHFEPPEDTEIRIDRPRPGGPGGLTDGAIFV